MSFSTKLKHYTFSAITALSPENPRVEGGNLGDLVSAAQELVAEAGVKASVQRQLIGIDQLINGKLVDLGPYGARTVLKGMSGPSIEQHGDCSIYDAPPTKEMIQRSGALVFVKYYSDAFGVTREPVVELVGFGSDMKAAWENARTLPKLSPGGQGGFQKEKSYMLWYRFETGKIVSGTIPYPFYLAVVKA